MMPPPEPRTNGIDDVVGFIESYIGEYGYTVIVERTDELPLSCAELVKEDYGLIVRIRQGTANPLKPTLEQRVARLEARLNASQSEG